jgi:hypothetical protein
MTHLLMHHAHIVRIKGKFFRLRHLYTDTVFVANSTHIESITLLEMK